MNFEFKKTNIYRAVKISKIYPPIIAKTATWLFAILSILSFLSFLKPGILNLTSQEILALFFLFLALTIKGIIWLGFLDDLSSNFLLRRSLAQQLSTQGKLKETNLAEYLDFRLAQALDRTIRFSESHNIPVSTPVLILKLWDNKRARLIFQEMEINKKLLKEKLEPRIKTIREENQSKKYTNEFLDIISKAAFKAAANFHRQIELRDFLTTAAEKNKYFREILAAINMESDDVDHVAAWEDFVEREIKRRKQFWRLENLRKNRGVGKKWAVGYTVNLDKYSTDISKQIRKQNLSIHLMAHKKEIYAMERILARSGANNILLVGRPGVGRTTTAYAFAKKVCQGNSFINLNDKRILELDTQAALAGLDTEGEMLNRLKTIFSEAASAGNVILLIDEIHNYLGSAQGPGEINIASVITPYLTLTNFQVIGTTNYEGWHKHINNAPAVKNAFTKIEIDEPSPLQTIMILEDMVPGLEKQYKTIITYRIIRDVVNLTDHHIQDTPFPEKAIDVLTETIVYSKRQNKNKVLPQHLNEVMSRRTEVPIGDMEEIERKKLLNLEQTIHQRIVDQEEAVKLISEAMRRARTGVSGKNRPMGTFLFLGPTGVGKTETAKALSAAYFGSEDKMVRFDMSEYQDTSSIERLIGAPSRNEPGLLTKALSQNPFSLVLFDEIEKSNPNILNLLLQVLDEGWLTDAFGRKVSFRDSIIIGTSNAGAELIRSNVKQGVDLSSFKEDLIDYLLKQGIFRPELLNRFDAAVVFKPLEHEHLIQIAKLMLNGLSKRLQEGMGITLVIDHDLVEKVAELGYKPEFGARPMRRVIQDQIESRVAKKILQDNLKRGDFVKIEAKDIS
ncbi:MAG: AAA domain-containing protein [Candidatus Portnoybacteria bacterium]|nr:AAA domain-containing protein [Candidatus Portnoybacteria bacterium]